MKRLNYSTQAIDDFKKNRILADCLDKDMAHIETLSRLLREGQKFILPDKGSLLFGESGIPNGTPRSRIPYPITIIETTWDYGENPQDSAKAAVFHTVTSSRRIALAFEVGEDIYESAVTEEGGFERTALACAPPEGGRVEEPIGYVVCAIAWEDNGRLWVPTAAAIFFPYDQEKALSSGRKNPRFSLKEALKRVDDYRRSRGVKVLPSKKQADVAIVPVSLLPHTAASHFGVHEPQRMLEMIQNDVGEEGRMITELSIALSCSNVETEMSVPSKIQQLERRRAKKAPLFDYHVLMISGQSAKTAPAEGGTHASPRTHLRRGHLRRLPHKEERIWINDTMVNPGKGFVAKDYALN